MVVSDSFGQRTHGAEALTHSLKTSPQPRNQHGARASCCACVRVLCVCVCACQSGRTSHLHVSCFFPFYSSIFRPLECVCLLCVRCFSTPTNDRTEESAGFRRRPERQSLTIMSPRIIAVVVFVDAVAGCGRAGLPAIPL